TPGVSEREEMERFRFSPTLADLAAQRQTLLAHALHGGIITAVQRNMPGPIERRNQSALQAWLLGGPLHQGPVQRKGLLQQLRKPRSVPSGERRPGPMKEELRPDVSGDVDRRLQHLRQETLQLTEVAPDAPEPVEGARHPRD